MAPAHNSTTNTTIPMKYFIVEDSVDASVFITSASSGVSVFSSSEVIVSSEVAVSKVVAASDIVTSSDIAASSRFSVFSFGVSISSGVAAVTSSVFCPAFSSSSLSLSSTGVSSKTVLSLSTTVSKCENGLLMRSFRAGSGVNETLVCPCISKRSPVLTLTLSRLSTSISLKAPSPFTFTYLSFSSASSINWKNSFTKLSAFFLLMPCFSASKSIKSCMFSFSFIIWKI